MSIRTKFTRQCNFGMEKYPQKINNKLNIILTSFWIAQAISLFGDRLNNFSLVALISRFASDPSITLSELYLAMFLPLFILAPIIGVAIDHLEKRWILIITDFLRALLVALPVAVSAIRPCCYAVVVL